MLLIVTVKPKIFSCLFFLDLFRTDIWSRFADSLRHQRTPAIEKEYVSSIIAAKIRITNVKKPVFVKNTAYYYILILLIINQI